MFENHKKSQKICFSTRNNDRNDLSYRATPNSPIGIRHKTCVQHLPFLPYGDAAHVNITYVDTDIFHVFSCILLEFFTFISIYIFFLHFPE